MAMLNNQMVLTVLTMSNVPKQFKIGPQLGYVRHMESVT